MTTTAHRLLISSSSTPWDIRTARYSGKVNTLIPTDTNYGMFMTRDGNHMFFGNDNDQEVNRWDMSTPWDITTATRAQASTVAVAGKRSEFGLYFNSTGTKMYGLSNSYDSVSQFSLSTPWNLNTLSFDNVEFSVLFLEHNCRGLHFSTDGSKMYIGGDNNDVVYQCTLSTPWNIATATYDNISKALNGVGNQSTDNRSFYFKPDGTKVYMAPHGFGGNANVFQWSLSTPWNLATATFDNVQISMSGTASQGASGLSFRSDGRAFYITGLVERDVFEFLI